MKYIGIFVCMLLVTSAFGSATIVNTTYNSMDDEKILQQGSPHKSTATGSFWIDLNPGGGRNGGYFEGDEVDDWDYWSHIYQDDFDDTDDLIDWASEEGVYCEIRNDEDLQDSTPQEGAWCSAAAETGGAITNEDSIGFSQCKHLFWLHHYVDFTNLEDFQITSATLYCDYKMYSWDFDDDHSVVYFNIYFRQSPTYWYLDFKKQGQNAPDYIEDSIWPDDKKCTDYWAPADGITNPNDLVDGYEVSKMANDQTLAEFLNWYFVEHIGDPAYLFIDVGFHVYVELFGAMFGWTELFKFWVDDFYIYCEYSYNAPPSDPIISGQTNGEYGTNYNYQFISEDPEGEDVWYYIKWGDGDKEEWIGPYSSGEIVTKGHTWDQQGIYMIEAKSKDSSGLESDWSNIRVTMPRNKIATNNILFSLFESFPNLFPALRHLLGL